MTFSLVETENFKRALRRFLEHEIILHNIGSHDEVYG